MELKLELPSFEKVKSVGFNRTFMELKHAWTGSNGLMRRGFNRTFMELKLGMALYPGTTAADVLIGPSWN